MAEERVLRRRAAILAASVAGYERLMGEDEDRTRAILKGYHIELVSKYRGEGFKTAGEGFLAEFAGAHDAVQCAAEIQIGIWLENMGRIENERIEYRMGVNLGDVIIQDDAFYGDVVNIAVRLENLAEPATVCVSGAVAGRIQAVLKVDLNDLGRQDRAGAAVQGLLRIYPGFTLETIRTASTGMPEAELERLLDGLRKAGLPA